jgi:hypothetical protein
MSGLLFLESDDFIVSKGVKGDNILTTQIKGHSLILFYSMQCTYCQSLISIFKTLPKVLGGCQYGMINISKNKECIAKSQQTNTPITCVPYIMFYYNGKPYIRYTGEYDIENIKNFVMVIANQIQKKINITNMEGIKENAKGTGIPEYSLGHPIRGNEDDGVCYLQFNTAYVN